MKPFLLTLIGSLILGAPLAQAQVIINQAALNQLAGISALPAPGFSPVPLPKPTPVVHRIYRRHPTSRPTAKPPVVSPAVVIKAKPATPMPQLPNAALLAPVLPKIAPSPPPPAAVQQAVVKPAPLPPKPAPSKPAAPPPVAMITFAAGAADLPAGTAATLKPFCSTHPANGQLITIDAYATANAADPSSAPRLSMNRAFAIRDALTACGVPGQNIIPRANGAAPGKDANTAIISVQGAAQ